MTSSRSSRFFLPTLVWAAGLSAWPCAQATSAAVTAPPPLALDTWRQCAATTVEMPKVAAPPIRPPSRAVGISKPAAGRGAGTALPALMSKLFTAASGVAIFSLTKSP